MVRASLHESPSLMLASMVAFGLIITVVDWLINLLAGRLLGLLIPWASISTCSFSIVQFDWPKPWLTS